MHITYADMKSAFLTRPCVKIIVSRNQGIRLFGVLNDLCNYCVSLNCSLGAKTAYYYQVYLVWVLSDQWWLVHKGRRPLINAPSP